MGESLRKACAGGGRGDLSEKSAHLRGGRSLLPAGQTGTSDSFYQRGGVREQTKGLISSTMTTPGLLRDGLHAEGSGVGNWRKTRIWLFCTGSPRSAPNCTRHCGAKKLEEGRKPRRNGVAVIIRQRAAGRIYEEGKKGRNPKP